ncbi:DUF1499 domain-containing protein [Roseovarius aestuarii]|nr:DUF1499 domain-containing protein [Roseovarius aestuarii]
MNDIVMWAMGLVALIMIGCAGWVRLAPVNVGRWHKASDVAGMGHSPADGGHVWRGGVAGDGRAEFKRLDHIIRATPRTRTIAGAVDAGMVSYETRSTFWGFPDYTTVSLGGGASGTDAKRYLEIYSRLRFGRSDFGVNRGRIAGWLQALGQG